MPDRKLEKSGNLHTLLIVMVCFLFSQCTFAGSDDFSTEDATSSDWKFTVTPYLWLAGLDASVDTNGGGTQSDDDYDFLSLDNLEKVGFITASASKNMWSIEGDAVYLKFSDSVTQGEAVTEADFTGTVFELLGAYRLDRFENVEVLFGARTLTLDMKVDIGTIIGGSNKESWTDPIIGIRYIRPISDRWRLLLRGEVGGFGVSTDLTTDASVGFDFSTTKNTSLYLGYRYMKYEFDKDDVLTDLTAQGYLFGFQFRF